MRADQVEIGMWVKHSGTFWEVLDSQIKGPIITFITHIGGHVSFWKDQQVEVSA